MKGRYWLLLLVPVAVAAHFLHAPPALTFILAGIALIPLSGLLGEATEVLAAHLGESWGGLLNATFGNAVELLIVIAALRAGELELVKASIVGSVLGNLLLILGCSLVVACWRRPTVSFNRELVLPSILNLFVAVTVMCFPTAAHFFMGDDLNEKMSLGISAVLLTIYVLTLIDHFQTPQDEAVATPHEVHHMVEVSWSKSLAVLILFVVTGTVIGMSEILVHHVEPFCDKIGLTKSFVGFIIIPIVGNIAEHFVAITVAAKNRMDLSLAVSIGSATQIGLFVTPVAVFAALFFGQELTLYFQPLALLPIAAAVFFAWFITQDGRGKRIEGVNLLGFYAATAWVFFLLK